MKIIDDIFFYFVFTKGLGNKETVIPLMEQLVGYVFIDNFNYICLVLFEIQYSFPFNILSLCPLQHSDQNCANYFNLIEQQ